MLKLARNLELPLDFVTERIAFLARTGAGKSGGMRVLAEEMLDAGQFIIFLDPKGDAYGIRSDYPVLIMGGEHGDVPLQANAGKFVADFLNKERLSSVLDVSEFSEADMVRFVADFGEQFYRANRAAVHIFIDEADEFAPQSGYDAKQAKCLGAIQRVQRRGRGRGIGVTVATQRSAVLNKSVLTQAGTLIAMQTTAPHDQKAVDAWLEFAATKEARKEIMSALPSLKPREAFVYSPQFLGLEPKRITFRAFKSFDSMATPKHGEKRQQPRKLADIDLGAVQRDMAAQLEEAKANDPAELRKQLADANRKLAAKSPVIDEKATQRAVAAATSERDRHWKGELAKIEKSHRTMAGRMAKIRELSTLNGEATVQIAQPADIPVHTARTIRQTPTQPVRREPVASVDSETGDIRLGGGMLRMVQELADRHPAQFSEAQWATMSRLKRTGGTWGTYKSRLVGAGLVEEDRGMWRASETAVAQFGNPSRAPQTPAELLDDWKSKLGKGPARMLDALWESPRTKQELAEAVQMEVTGGTFGTYLSRLRSNELVEEIDGQFQLTDAFS